MSRKSPHILIAHWAGLELFTDADLARFGEVGTVVNETPVAAWTDEGVDALLADTDVIVGHWGCPPLDATALDLAPRLGLFTYAAGTVKGTVTDAVWARDIRVTSGANANAEPVAEFTLAAILFANKAVTWSRDVLRDPSIEPKRQMGDVAVGNYDKTIGIVGASLIGRRVIELLKPFPRLRVTLYDPFVTADDAAAMGVDKFELDELSATCDVLSIHAPALASTLHLIGRDELAALRTGATVINTARGPIIDHDALLDELHAGRLYAMLDVTDPEPLPEDSALRHLPNVFLTPHLAGAQGTELARMAEYAVEEIRRWSAGEPGLNTITAERLPFLA